MAIHPGTTLGWYQTQRALVACLTSRTLAFAGVFGSRERGISLLGRVRPNELGHEPRRGQEAVLEFRARFEGSAVGVEVRRVTTAGRPTMITSAMTLARSAPLGARPHANLRHPQHSSR